MSENITVLPCYVAGFRSKKDRSWTITLETNELPPVKLAELAEMQNKFGVMAFKQSEFQHNEITALDEIDTELEGGKSQSQRVRNCLFVLWKENNEGFSKFSNYYESKTEKYIEFLKSKMPAKV